MHTLAITGPLMKRAQARKRATKSRVSRPDISKLAETLARSLGYLKDRDIFKIVQKVGGRVEVRDFWDAEHTGSLTVDKDHTFKIYIPNHTSIERDRFTVAHEFGHYVLHYVLDAKADTSPRPFVRDRYGTGVEEWEANLFAASFLMPSREFKRV